MTDMRRLGWIWRTACAFALLWASCASEGDELGIDNHSLRQQLAVQGSSLTLSQPRAGHTATLLTDGMVLVAGGGSSATIEVVDQDGSSIEMVGALGTNRSNHTATLLLSGKVLVAGGSSEGMSLKSTEIYDPLAKAFAVGPDLDAARESHTVTLLKDGRVLLIGGVQNFSTYLNVCEIFDPKSGVVSSVGTLSVGRAGHTANLLQNGQVLVCGGKNESGPLASCEIFSPSANTWTSVTPMSTPRNGHSATVLGGGKVLVVGGVNQAALASAELFDPLADAWAPTAVPSIARYLHSAVLLGDGKVVISGGYTGNYPIAEIEVFDPSANVWSLPSPLGQARFQHTSTTLVDGTILVVGGLGTEGWIDSIELISIPPSIGSWKKTGDMVTPRTQASAVLLNNGKVLVASGLGSGQISLKSAELYDPNSGQWAATGDMNFYYCHNQAAVLLPTGNVLVAGGGCAASKAEIFDLTTGTWTLTGSLVSGRQKHTLTNLSTGFVLAAGGYTNTAELFDSSSGTWATTDSMVQTRAGHTATTLLDGRILVAGGMYTTEGGGEATTAAVEIYNPLTGHWTQASPMSQARDSHIAALLPTGDILVAGGTNRSGPFSISAELYNPGTNTWSQTGSMVGNESHIEAIPLPTGKVLVAGNYVQLFNFALEQWLPGPAMFKQRYWHTSTLLKDGSVLVAGGQSGSSILLPTEIYSFTLPSAAPFLISVETPVVPGWEVTVSGVGLLGLSPGGSGGTQTSPSGYPVPSLKDQTNTVFPSAIDLSDEQFKLTIPCILDPGTYNLQVAVGGVQSNALSIEVQGVPQGEACSCDGACKSPPGPCFFTDGTCSNDQCSYSLMPTGTYCDDQDLCTTEDICDTFNICIGTSYSCLPNQCQQSSTCDGKGGCIPVNKAIGTSCDDLNPCTIDDVCNGGGTCVGKPKCVVPPPAVCLNATSSRVFNTQGACDPGDGSCQYTFNDITCTQGCGGGCNAVTGLCTGDPCCNVKCDAPPNTQCFTAVGACQGGACSYSQKLAGTSCDDGNSCTTGDKCDAAGTCASTNAAPGAGCSDGNPCTKIDQCDGAGYCAGTLYTCQDPKQCQQSVNCDGSGGCVPVNKPSGSFCDDGIPCTKNECDGSGQCQSIPYTCSPGQCDLNASCDGQGGCSYSYKDKNIVCDDGNPCTAVDVCDGAGNCAGQPANGITCDDGDPCTKMDSCDSSGACKGVLFTCPAPTTCQQAITCNGAGGCVTVNQEKGTLCVSDGVSCTEDICDGMGFCIHPINPSECLIEGQCVAGGTPDPMHLCRGCMAAASQTSWIDFDVSVLCDDNDDCTSGDHCDGDGACVGKPTTCLPGPCDVSVSCDGVGGCNRVFMAAGTECDDGDSCTEGDKCSADGSCGGSIIDACTADVVDGSPEAYEGEPVIQIEADTEIPVAGDFAAVADEGTDSKKAEADLGTSTSSGGGGCVSGKQASPSGSPGILLLAFCCCALVFRRRPARGSVPFFLSSKTCARVGKPLLRDARRTPE